MADASVPKLGRDIDLKVEVARYDVVNSNVSAVGVVAARLGGSGQYVQFTLNVEHGGKSWSLKKRFSDVAALHEVLSKLLPSVPQLPSKSTVRHFSPEYCETRKVLLSAYLEDLVSRRDVLNCRETWQFFDLTQFPTFQVGSKVLEEPVLIAEIQEKDHPIVDFLYNPDQAMLVIASADQSWTSLIDTKVKAKLESDSPNVPTSQMTVWKHGGDLRFAVQTVCRYTANITCLVQLQVGGCTQAFCGLSDGTIGVHDVNTPASQRAISNAVVPWFKHTAATVAMAVDTAECWLIVASKDTTLQVYSVEKQTRLGNAKTQHPTVSMAYCQVTKRLFTGMQSGAVSVFDTKGGSVSHLSVIPVHQDIPVSCILYEPGNMFVGSRQGMSQWEVTEWGNQAIGRAVHQVEPVSASPLAMAWSSATKEILVVFPNGSLAAVDMEADKVSYVMTVHRHEVTALRWFESERQLLTASKDKTVAIWNFPSPNGERPMPETVVVSASTGVSAAPPQQAAAAAVSPPSSTATSTTRATVVGAAPGAVFQADSDDDLAGWDS